jgi:DNA-binding winged helix-turn-helix (wHTH) protein/TolB-like protein/tetratricopeptide (TPR) repeat protein
MADKRTLYDFGDFTLDTVQHVLRRRGAEKPIPLTSKVFETLRYLLEHAGETIDKDELLSSIWPGVIVEENSLTQNISTLRQLFGEVRGEHRYIVTVPRKGYRFVANVTAREADTVVGAGQADQSSQDHLPRSSRFWGKRAVLAAVSVMLILITALALFIRPIPSPHPEVQSLAILPFKPLLLADRNESLELGMTESLISSLGRDNPLVISPLSSVRRYGALDQDPIAAGRELGVHTVLEGSLQRRDDRLRVSVRLLRVRDGRQLWAHTFDQAYTTIFDVQDDIGAKVSEAVSVHWAGSAATRGAPYTDDPEAYALYMSGRFAWTRQTEASLLQAIDFFEQAIARDPNYALAYSGLADSHALLAVFGIRAPHEEFPKAQRAVERAMAIDPDLAAAHSAMGHIKAQFEQDWDGASREYARALALDPSVALTHHRRALLYAMRGDIDSAMAASQRAQQLEPLWLAPKAATGNFLFYARRYAASIHYLEQVLALDERAGNARSSLIRSLIAAKSYDRAIAECDRHPLQTPGSNAFRAQALALSGRSEEAHLELTRLLGVSKQRYVAAYDIALIYAALDDTENTFLWLERALEDRSTLINFLAIDPMFDAFHADARFAALVQRIRRD